MSEAAWRRDSLFSSAQFASGEFYVKNKKIKKNLYDVNVQKQQAERGSRRRRTDRREVRGRREAQGGELKEQSVVSGRKRIKLFLFS